MFAMEATGKKVISSKEYAKRPSQDGNIQKSYRGGSFDATALDKLQEALCFFADPQEHSLVLDFSCKKEQGTILIRLSNFTIVEQCKAIEHWEP
jgi:hypothetical protein